MQIAILLYEDMTALDAIGPYELLSRLGGYRPETERVFKRPSALSRGLVQTAWLFLGLRFSCFSIAGRKPLERG